MAMGTSVFQIRIELIFRRCWNLITYHGGRGSPANVGRAANLMDGSTLTASGRLQRGPFFVKQ